MTSPGSKYHLNIIKLSSDQRKLYVFPVNIQYRSVCESESRIPLELLVAYHGMFSKQKVLWFRFFVVSKKVLCLVGCLCQRPHKSSWQQYWVFGVYRKYVRSNVTMRLDCFLFSWQFRKPLRHYPCPDRLPLCGKRNDFTAFLLLWLIHKRLWLALTSIVQFFLTGLQYEAFA